jgi:hypothetical protein
MKDWRLNEPSSEREEEASRPLSQSAYSQYLDDDEFRESLTNGESSQGDEEVGFSMEVRHSPGILIAPLQTRA